MVRYKGECVKTAGNCTNAAYICNKFTKKITKIDLFSLTLLRNFPLKSDFLGIFKNSITGFCCILEKCIVERSTSWNLHPLTGICEHIYQLYLTPSSIVLGKLIKNCIIFYRA
jgi:hypothetical protein